MNEKDEKIMETAKKVERLDPPAQDLIDDISRIVLRVAERYKEIRENEREIINQ